MSRVNDEQRYKKSGTSSGAPVKKPRSRYVVYRPSKEEREFIRADKTSLSVVIAALAKWVLKDAKLTVGHKAENDAYFVHLTDLGVDWQEAVTLSVWHSDWETALRSLEHGLKTRFTEFPDVQLELFPDELSW